MISNKEKYQQFCKTEKDLPIFMQHWWLDTVCGIDGWDVAIYEEKNKVVGVFPYPIKKKFIFKTILRPNFSPWLGPWISKSYELLNDKKVTLENNIYSNLIKQLPAFDWFNVDCNPQLKNWSQFYWSGFKQSTKYTYIIDFDENIEDYKKSLPKKTRQRINQAYEKCSIVEENSIDDLYNLLKLTYQKQGLEVPVKKGFLSKLFNKLEKKYSTRIIKVVSKEDGEVLSSSLVVWDYNYLYLLIGGTNPKYKKINSKYLVIWEAINLAYNKGLSFNFEGSMIERIESLYRQFNPKMMTYFNLEKINSKLLKLYFALKN